MPYPAGGLEVLAEVAASVQLDRYERAEHYIAAAVGHRDALPALSFGDAAGAAHCEAEWFDENADALDGIRGTGL